MGVNNKEQIAILKILFIMEYNKIIREVVEKIISWLVDKLLKI